MQMHARQPACSKHAVVLASVTTAASAASADAWPARASRSRRAPCRARAVPADDESANIGSVLVRGQCSQREAADARLQVVQTPRASCNERVRFGALSISCWKRCWDLRMCATRTRALGNLPFIAPFSSIDVAVARKVRSCSRAAENVRSSSLSAVKVAAKLRSRQNQLAPLTSVINAAFFLHHASTGVSNSGVVSTMSCALTGYFVGAGSAFSQQPWCT